MSPISRRSLIAVVMIAAILTTVVALPLQAAVYLSPVPPKPVPSCTGWFYWVVPGDSLNKIAARFGVSVSTLQHCNGISNPNRINSGWRLVIPTHKVEPMPHPKPWPQPKPQPSNCCYYRVHWGDTLASIAHRYHTTVWEIMHLNGLHNPNYVRSGSQLKVPCYNNTRWDDKGWDKGNDDKCRDNNCWDKGYDNKDIDWNRKGQDGHGW